jgi:hypothetical protein
VAIPRPSPPGIPAQYVSPGDGQAATVRLPRAAAYTDDAGYWNQIALEVAAWIEATSKAVAADLMDGLYAPFSARVTLERQSAYYAELLFYPGGMPNPQAWKELYQTAGADGLVEAVKGASRWRDDHGMPVVMPPPIEPGVPPGEQPAGVEAPPVVPPPGAEPPPPAPWAGPPAPPVGPGPSREARLPGGRPASGPGPYTPSTIPPVPPPGAPPFRGA